jgi:pimeloyl-ACP methyl ester carboxylesterase
MTDPITLADHCGVRLRHGKPRVNGVEIHYAIGGTGDPVFLLHGVPKTMSYWRRVVPLENPAALAQAYLGFFAGR